MSRLLLSSLLILGAGLRARAEDGDRKAPVSQEGWSSFQQGLRKALGDDPAPKAKPVAPPSAPSASAAKPDRQSWAKQDKAAATRRDAKPSLKCFYRDPDDGRLYLRQNGEKVADSPAVDASFVTKYERGRYDYVYDHPDPHVGRLGCKDGLWSKVTEEGAAACGEAAKDNGLSRQGGSDCAKTGYVRTGLVGR